MIKNRKYIRKDDHDYHKCGSYFITSCTKSHQCLFGEIDSGTMVLNEVGEMICETWEQIPQNYPDFQLGLYQIMPDHIHGIVKIVGSDTLNPLSLSDLMERYKSLTTQIYIDGVKNKGWQPFDKKLWQRGFYDRIIRNGVDLGRIEQYIINNPNEWDKNLIID
jgi:putative transposase